MLIAWSQFKNMEMKRSCIYLLLLIISGCGGDSKTVEVMPNAFGQILDSKVSGLNYKSGEYNGVTDENGEFGYIQGEQIQFFVGDIAIGYEVEPEDILTPFELANNHSLLALNIARFLQSLDDDALLENGIQIHKSSHSYAKGKRLDFLSLEWQETNVDHSEIEQLVYLLTSGTLSGARYSVSNGSAYYHFASTLNYFMSEINTQIENEIDVTGCKTHNECKVHYVPTAFIGYCPPPSTEYIYSDATTDIQKVTRLTEERNEILGIKSGLYYAADFPITHGVCFTSSTPQYPSCNKQSQCEFSTNFPFDEIDIIDEIKIQQGN
jgi:hypothetical protein